MQCDELFDGHLSFHLDQTQRRDPANHAPISPNCSAPPDLLRPDHDQCCEVSEIQVCAEPRTSALNMTLPAAAARMPAAVDR